MERGSEEIVKPVKPETLLLIAILSLALTCFWDVFIVFLPSIAFCTQNVSFLIPTPDVDLQGQPFVMFLLLMLLIQIPILRKRLTTSNLVYIYVTALGVSYFSSWEHPWTHDIGLVVTRTVTMESYLRYVPDFVAAPRDVAELLISGVGSVGAIPWNMLFPGIIWRFLLVALFGGISIGIGSIFRRQWMDVERIPFPHVMLAHTCLVNVENIGKKEWYQRKPFLLGILAGILLAIPLSGATLFPWFPDIYGWRSNTCGPGSWQITSPDTPWNLGIAKHPPLYALLLLVPLHSLFSVLIYTFIFEASLFISYYGFGAYSGYLQVGFCGRNWCPPNTPYAGPPLYYGVVSSGAMLGLFVITVILERNHIITTLRAALGRRSEQEKLEPISYRASWMVFIISYILLMALFMFTGFSPWLSFVLPLSGIVTWFAMVQLWGRIGFTHEPCYNFTPGFIRMLAWPSVVRPDVTSTDLALTPEMSRAWIGWGYSWGGSFYTVMASYRMASLTGVNPRNVLKVLFVGLFVSMLVTEIVQIAITGTYGATRFTGKFSIMPLEGYSSSLWSFPSESPLTEMIPHLAIGFVFMVVTRYLCSKFLWLPDPIVAIVAWDWVISLHGVWFACLAAWAIKYIILKIGGSKLYESWVVPFVGGFILGDALEVLLAALTAYGLLQVA
jgi:hypothetical protein